MLHAKHTGSSNFALWNYGPGNQKIDLLVNTIGNYEGFRPLDFMDDEITTRFEVKADGEWQLDILPLTTAPIVDVPASVKQSGDYVFWLRGSSDLLKAQSNSDSNFVIYGYSASDRRKLLVNEIAPYSGTVMLPSNTYLIVVEAEGAWTIDVTAK